MKMLESVMPGGVATIAIDERERGTLARIVRVLLANYGPAVVDDNEIAEVAEIGGGMIRSELPYLSDALSAVGVPMGPAAATLSGLPHGRSGHDDVAFARILALSLGKVHGSCFQYVQQNDGRIVADLIARGDAPANTNSTTGTFEAHTDDAIVYPPFRVRHIALMGVLNENRARTGFIPVDELLADIPEYIGTLESPMYQFRAPTSFSVGSVWSSPRPILERGADGQMLVACPTYNTGIVGNDPRATAAFTAFCAAIERHTHWVTLDATTYLVFHNGRGLHAREATGSGRRHVLRIYWRPDLSALREQCRHNGFVFDLNGLMTVTAA